METFKNWVGKNLTETCTKRVNALMQTCGFYDESGEFAFKVGLPGKSGVGGGIVALLIAAFGICLIIGALKNWDWLYEPDKHYQNNWTMGQISRYLGRDMARVIGFITGVFFIIVGIYFSYIAFTYKA